MGTTTNPGICDCVTGYIWRDFKCVQKNNNDKQPPNNGVPPQNNKPPGPPPPPRKWKQTYINCQNDR